LSARTLNRPLAAGAALFADAMVDDVLIHRGQQVNLVAAVGGLEVRATGLALADARAADRIKVQNSTSLRVVEGVVETADVIRITP
jgi:flagella basal body P-ring formation protein FlgA